MRVLNYLVGIFLSLLPERYRAWWQPGINLDFRRAAFFSGLLQFFGCLAAFIVRYLIFFQQRVMEIGGEVIGAGAEEALGAKSVQMGMGFLTTLEYLTQPLTLVLIYFGLEGAVRFLGPLVSDEIVGTLPLHLVSLAHGGLAAAQAERALGPCVIDKVERGDGKEFDLRIASCRPKENWDNLMTVAYQDELYEVVKEERWARPRPYVYYLRKMPAGKVVRGLHHYRPDEVLEEKK